MKHSIKRGKEKMFTYSTYILKKKRDTERDSRGCFVTMTFQKTSIFPNHRVREQYRIPGNHPSVAFPGLSSPLEKSGKCSSRSIHSPPFSYFLLLFFFLSLSLLATIPDATPDHPHRNDAQGELPANFFRVR